MRLARVRIRNFRCFKTEVALDLGDITAIIGKNDAGKSAILDALAIWFEEESLDSDDATVDGDKTDVRIICEFDELPRGIIIDVDYKTDLASEYLLNAAGHLEVHKAYNASLPKSKVSPPTASAMHPTRPGYADLLTLKNQHLKARAKELGVDLTGVDVRINAAIRKRIWSSCDDLQLQPSQIPLDAEGTRKTWEELKNALPVYGLFKSDRPSTDQDAEAQDPMKFAVKEAIRAKQEELDAIAEHVEAEVRGIAERTVAKIREMDPSLANELNPRFTPPNWASIFKITLTGDGEIPVNKRGSGVRRLILMNFFRAKIEQRLESEQASTVIFAVEEPETSQHPNSQRMLLGALGELSQQPGSQVLLTTHTPTLARLLPVSSLRFLTIEDDGNRRICGGDDETYRLVAKSLGVLPDHGVRLFIGVEGKNDVNFLKQIAGVLSSAGVDVPDLTRLEDDGQLVFIPLGGSNLDLWVSRLKELNRPEFHLFDRDVAPPTPSPHEEVVAAISARAGCTALLTSKLEMENYLHSDAIAAAYPGVTVTVEDFNDVPALVAEAVHAASGSPNPWATLLEEKRNKKMSQAKARLSTQAVAAMTAGRLLERDPMNEVIGWLRQIAQMLTA